MKYSAIILTALTTLLFSCTREPLAPLSNTTPATNNVPKPTTNLPASKSILVDASKDGGAWWFPQGPGGFSEINHHQGKALADYFRNLGYQVDELPRGAIITSELLDKYSKVIRPSAFFSYSNAEIAAYTSFLNRSSALLLVSDHMTNTVNDQLSASLGLVFEGTYWGPITSIQPHAITSGITSLNYIAGSVIKSWDPSKITVLGHLNIQSGNEIRVAAAMGIVNHPSSKIFFIGDITDVLLHVSQPLISNLNNWLFQ